MKKMLNFALAAIFIILTGCSNQTTFSPSNVTTADIKTVKENTEKPLEKNIKKQLQIILNNYTWPKSQSPYTVPMYTITDLDQNGRLEFISSLQEGSGRYTYAEYQEVNEYFDNLNIYKLTNKEGDSEADIEVNCVPVYYDLNNDIYYYIFDDLIRDGINVYYQNKRAISLKDGKLSERILAFKTSFYDSVECEDADRNKISESEYTCIADTVFSDFIKKEAHFSWFSLSDLDLNKLNNNIHILQKSYNGFLIQELSK